MKKTVYDSELPVEVRKVRTRKGYAIVLRRMMMIFSGITAMFGFGYGASYLLGLSPWMPALNGLGMAFGGVIAMGIITLFKNVYDRQLKEIQKQYPYLHLDSNDPVELLVSHIHVREEQKDYCPLSYYTDEEKRQLQRKYPSRRILDEELIRMNRESTRACLQSKEAMRIKKEIKEEWANHLKELRAQGITIGLPDEIKDEEDKKQNMNAKDVDSKKVEQDPLQYNELQNLAKEIHTLSNKKHQDKRNATTDNELLNDNDNSVEELRESN